MENRQDDRRRRIRPRIQSSQHQQRHLVSSEEDTPLLVRRITVQNLNRDPLQNSPRKHREVSLALPPTGGDLHLHVIRPGDTQKFL